MDIKRAKQEIKDAIEAYLLKDAYGEYKIPQLRQRPILLMGPPGVGKTQVMEQIARECKINLVAYTITHHTRQSAVGLPFIREKSFGGQAYSVTEYTMSEIIASVYEKMETTGIREGILFIDEINCVSETLAPMMLQFLQCKTFGNQKVPEGWIIVAAGNPPEYNKSVREFDIVTLDRIKKIDVEADFKVWKEYAYRVGIHPAVMAYLELRKDHFYRIETTVDGKLFATARGWEDLSQLLLTYEELDKKADREVVHQYIQHWKIAKDFANYLELYEKYKKDYGLEKILSGCFSQDTFDQLKFASFDERLSVVGLLTGRLSEEFRNAYVKDRVVTDLFGHLKAYQQRLKESPDTAFSEAVKEASEQYDRLRRNEQMGKMEDQISRQVSGKLEAFALILKEEHREGRDAMDRLKELFTVEKEGLEQLTRQVQEALSHAFAFMEQAFSNSQEMVVFITELNTNYYSIQFIKEHGCEEYYRYNRELLFGETREKILQEMDELEGEIGDRMR